MISNPFLEGEIMMVDKPLHWTSFDVVKKLRYVIKKHYNIKKIKVGHAGTLDPLATGLLVICTGKKTKSIDQFLTEDKSYVGRIKLGATTPSFDLETKVDKTYPVPKIDDKLISDVEKRFQGSLMQVPPIFSAKKIKGKRAYDLARENKTVELEPNPISISKINLTAKQNDEIHFECTCSKGTYLRSLARDIGYAINSGAHLIELRRISSGEFHIKNAKTVDEWIDIIKTS
jgi:tRNA pseudouridine55 synthase